jgi:hypothetical protein
MKTFVLKSVAKSGSLSGRDREDPQKSEISVDQHCNWNEGSGLFRNNEDFQWQWQWQAYWGGLNVLA